MAKSEKQKLKLLYLADMLRRCTDEEHGLTMKEIIDRLEQAGIRAERKSIYQDMEDLRSFGYDILCERSGRSYSYKLVAREFELPELKLLVDSVQSAKFITEKKSRMLIKKLESLASTHDAQRLHRQVIISGRVKTENKHVFYSVDTIHAAINNNVQVRFQYDQWTLDKKLEPRHGGAWYQVSPRALLWDDENYYLLGYEHERQTFRHYRVDKMRQLSITQERCEGSDSTPVDLARYAKSLFGMFTGESMRVTLECDNSMVGVLLDRFGTDIPIIRLDEEHFETAVDVTASDQFIGWVVALGGVRITGPDSMVERMKAVAARLAAQYQ